MTELIVALLLTFERVFIGAGIVLLTLASYAWWGNPQSLLGGLANEGINCLLLGVGSYAGHRFVLARAHRKRREEKSRASTARLKLEDG